MTIREKLERLATNMWWCWNQPALALFRELNPDVFESHLGNPISALGAADPDVLERDDFRAAVDAVYQDFQEYMTRPPALPNAPRVSYFCMEYGLHESLPVYSGGLGILAGDHAKAASDWGISFTAVGLFQREGYFDQHFNDSGWQLEAFRPTDPEQHCLTRVLRQNGEPLVIEVEIGHQLARVQAWRLELGRTNLYLLDADVDGNPPEIREITKRLYQGGRDTRIMQEIILGVGGVRLLRALGIETDVFHINEGHCAFLTLELLREHLLLGESLESAEESVRETCVFTTHTPVMAGHDRFNADLLLYQLASMRASLSLSEEHFLSYGRVRPSDPHEAFTMTVLALKLSRRANGVSRLNGEVARQQWVELYPDRPVDEVPIGHVTNGIHIPTWTTPYSASFLDQHFPGWREHGMRPAFWEQVQDLPDETLWEYRATLRRLMIDAVVGRLEHQSLRQSSRLNPDALTIGFARRFATYKRAPLLFHDLERVSSIFGRLDRPVQIIYSGKAHPADEGGKHFIRTIYEMTQRPELSGRLLFVENYNMRIGRLLTSGCDVWLNNPRRPMEASGTSGQKICVHGGLNLSILDGWWPEGYNGRNGWAIGEEASSNHSDIHVQDAEDARLLYDTLEDEVIPAFYDRDSRGIPSRWVQYMRNAISGMATRFSAQRMVADYVHQVYRTHRPEQLMRQHG